MTTWFGDSSSAGDQGRIRLEQTYGLEAEDPDGLGPLKLRGMQLDGMTIDGAYDPEMPVANRRLEPGTHVGEGY